MAAKEPGETTPALVLKRQDFSENSQIARLMTRTRGKASVLAKGIRKPNPELLGAFDLAQLGEATIRWRKGDSLHLVTRWRVVTGFPGLRNELGRFYAACHVTEVLCEGHRDLDPDTAAFDLAVETLAALEIADPSAVPAVTARFDLRWLAGAGFAPVLDGCAVCAKPAPPKASVKISPGRGGIVCGDCLGGTTPGLIPLASAGRRFLLAARDASAADALGLSVAATDVIAVRRVLDAALEHVMEKELKSARFLREIDVQRASDALV